MRFVIGAFFRKRGYEICHRGLVFLKGVMRFVKKIADVKSI